MKSSVPKVLHAAAGRPLLFHSLLAAAEAGADRVVCVVSPETREPVQALLAAESLGLAVELAVQDLPRGTADAVKAALPRVESERVLVLCGDTPLLRAEDLRGLVAALDATPGAELALMTAILDEPSGYGRVLRDGSGRVLEIREHRDLRSDAERSLREVNAGVYVAKSAALRTALERVRNDNAAGEFYLTDAVALLAERGPVVGLVGHSENLLGVNDRSQLALAEELLFQRIAREHQMNGVSVRAGARIDAGIRIGKDARIESGVVLRGKSSVGEGSIVDVGCVIEDSEIGAAARIKPYSVVSESRVASGAQIGPFAHLRPGSLIDEDAHIGNFVETKKTHVRKGAKANHLAYLGDGDIGEGANVGAGTIFCNYDGFRKHTTVIGRGAFIGSDSQLVAPVRIGDNAYVGTGTTVTKDVPDDALAIGRAKQENKLGYAPRLRARLKADAKPKSG